LWLVGLCLVYGSVGDVESWDLREDSGILFERYVAHYNAQFRDQQEREERFGVFQENLQTINQLNAQGKTKFGLNKFALLSKEEFRSQYLNLKTIPRSPNDPVAEEYSQQQISAIPDEFDWVSKGAVTGVKDQGSCGSCWAFSATGNMEGQWFLAGHPLTSLSEQNLVDCDHECLDKNDCDQGCNGGLQPNAYNYVIKNGGIDTEASYPYEGIDDTCKFKSTSVGAKISNWTFVPQDEAQIAAYLVEHGPLAVAVEADVWQFYVGGVLYVPCGTTLDHGVLLVGYGVETDILGQQMPYWTIKNSWGSSWGESGYIYIERGTGLCGVNLYVTNSIV